MMCVKRFIGVQLVFVLLLMAAFSSPVFASETVVESGYFGADESVLSWTFYDDGLLEISGEGSMPSTGNNIPWAAYKSSIASIRINEGVVNIGKNAFKDCSKLKSVELPDSLVRIESNAFSNCKMLTTVDIPNGVTGIEQGAFSSCQSLKTLRLPSSLKTIGQSAFASTGIVDIEIPEGIMTIPAYLFSGCKYLEHVSLPNSLVSISQAFGGCENLKTITLPDGLTKIGQRAFQGSALEQITIPASVTEINLNAFYDCSNLKEVYFSTPSSLKIIYGGAFDGCAIVNLELPYGLEQISPGAINNCKDLERLYLPRSIKAFAGASGDQPDPLLYGCPKAIAYCDAGSYAQRYLKQESIKYDLTSGHTVNTWSVVNDSTCSNEGLKKGVCVTCYREVTETIPKKEHVWEEGYTIDKSPACTEEGYKSRHCINCGESTDGTIIPATGHSFSDEYTIDKQATCIEEGVKSIHCTVCGVIREGSVCLIPKSNHQWNDKYTIDVWSTCVQEGSQSIHCSVCGAINESTVRAIPVTDHTYPNNWTTTKSATCTEDGVKEKKCIICGNKISETIPATGHIWKDEFTVDKPATCTEPGLESIHCSVCDAVQESSGHVIPARGHSYGEWTTTEEPTCTEPGVKQKTCDYCGDVITEGIPALGHSYGDWGIAEEPTCTEPGVKQKTCERCGDAIAEEIPVKGHAWNTEYTVDRAPTCTEAGLESIHCSVCDAVQEGSGRAIPMTSHAFGAWETVTAATYDAAGLEEHVCRDCGFKEQREIPMLPRTDLTEVEISGINDMTFTGTEIVQGQTLKANGAAITEGTDYKVVYENNVNAGIATMTLTGIGGYKGKVTKTFEILPANVEDMSFSALAAKTYDGKAKTPDFTATFNDIKYPSKTTDQFDVKYSNNKNAGTASVKVTGKGNFTGETTLNFTIKPKAITPTVTLSSTKFTYTGKAKSPGVTVKYGSTTLKKGTHYTVSQSSGRINPGKYSVTVKMTGNYSGSKKVNFYVKGDLSKSATKVKVSSISSKTYTGSAIKPSPTVKAIGPKGKVVKLKKGIDYTLSYSNNKRIGKATITIKGKGNYTGTKKVTFKIVPKGTSITDLEREYVIWKKRATQTSGYQLQISTSSSYASSKTKSMTFSNTNTVRYNYSEQPANIIFHYRIRTFKNVNGTKYYSSWHEYHARWWSDGSGGWGDEPDWSWLK